ncbi:MAG: YggT family protein [candidate division NC10 bacterium]|nr:YggT family protein [candidate division NC10 bacterium]
MFVLGNFLSALAVVLQWILQTYMFIVIARALISWVSPNPYNPIVQFLTQITEPVLRPVRRLLPLPGGIDFSPLVVILGLAFLQSFLVPTLRQLARGLQ